MWLAVAAAALSYIGSVCWLYESSRPGKAALFLVAAFSLLAALFATWSDTMVGFPAALRLLSIVTSGLVLGLTTAAMLLGHWYLNAPGMELAPLRRLLIAAALAVGAQILISAAGLANALSTDAGATVHWWLFVALRWSFGLGGTLLMLWMAWQTLKVPNTQSATGILYVAVIFVFVGELAGLLLSAKSAFPL
jgi:hypothetical protein